MPECSTQNIPQRVCDLEEAVSQILDDVGHPPMTVTEGETFSFDAETQVLVIPEIPAPPTIPDPDTVVWADDAARAALAPQSLHQIGIQTTDATNGNFSFWAPTGLAAGNWTLKVATMGAQNSNAVSITGGIITGITDLAVADGGTGASSAAGARQNLTIATAAPVVDTLDWLTSDNWAITLSANTTFVFSNTVDGMSIMLAVIDPTGYTVGWPAGVLWPGGTAPAHSGVGKTDVYAFVRIGGQIYGSAVSDYTTP